MGAPLSLFTGVWFSLFGGAVIWWCAAEVRLRRTLRRVGVSGMARVVAADELDPVRVPVTAAAVADQSRAERARTEKAGTERIGTERIDTDQIDTDQIDTDRIGADAADADADAETPDVDPADNAPLLCFEVEGHGEVITLPRGWTSIRRSSSLAVGALVPIAYDPLQPTRVALQGVPQSRSDVFWLVLGLVFAAAGVMLLATAF